MAIVFTDDQIKAISKNVADLPLIISNPAEGTGLVEQKASVLVQKDDILDLDNQNKIFSDNWIDTIEAYHGELKSLNLDLRTDYLNADLESGGLQASPHYTPSWPNVVPILLASNNGNPVGAHGGPTEQSKIDDIDFYIDKLLNGFADGATDTTLDVAYTTGSGFIEIASGTLNNGDWIIIDHLGESMLALVGALGGYCTGETNPPQLTEVDCTGDGGTWNEAYTITPLSTDKNFAIGARVRNFHAGFTNAERGRVSTNYAFDVQVYFENNINTETTEYKDFLIAHKVFVDANGELVPLRKANVDNEKGILQSVIDDIVAWEGTIVANANGKYTDAAIVPLLIDNLNLRTTRIPIRVAEIIADLGSISQAGDGSVTGTGVYLSLWEWLLIRISKSGGTLIQYNNFGLIEMHFDTKIAIAESTLEQYENTFAITLISSDTDLGEISFTVDNVSDFSVSQSVKIMDNESIVYTRNIDDITGNVITLDSGIPVELLVENQARIVRQK